MFTRIVPVLENGTAEWPEPRGTALAKVIEVHPDLEPLLEFYSADPVEIAVEIGMVSPQEDDLDEDLKGVDFGPRDWHEPSAGIAVVERAHTAIQSDPESIRRVVYDPTLTREDVLLDLQALKSILEHALDQETRFYLAAEGTPGLWPRPGRG